MKMTLFALVVFLLAIGTVSAGNGIMAYHFSLGTDSCRGISDCHQAIVNMFMPLGVKNEQYVKMIITPDCFSNPPNETETYELVVRCFNPDTNYVDRTFDLKPYVCNDGDNLIVWTQMFSSGIRQVGNQYYGYFWCSFIRNTTNTNRLPMAMTVVVDSSGLTSQDQENTEIVQRDTVSYIISSTTEVIIINLNTIRIIFLIASLIIVMFGIAMAIAFIPLMLKYIQKKLLGRR